MARKNPVVKPPPQNQRAHALRRLWRRVQPHHLRLIAGMLILPTMLTVIVSSISLRHHTSVGLWTRDPATLTNANPFWGVLSNVGMLFWSATVTLCWFGAGVLRTLKRDRALAHVLVAVGLLTLLLLLDDLFLFHEVVFPTYLHIGETVLAFGYVVAVGALLWHWRAVVLHTDIGILLMALGLLGSSVVIDRLPPWWGEWSYLVEDGPKLFGIVLWCTYWGHTLWDGLVHPAPFDAESP
jgi:hypothetical protein